MIDHLKDDLIQALEEGMSALARGEERDAWLSQYPDLAEQLRPILEAAEAAKELPVENIPSLEFQRTRTRILKRAAELRVEQPEPRQLKPRQPKPLQPMPLRRSWFPSTALTALIVFVVLFSSAGGLVVASANKIPGDNLYRVKRTVEALSLSLAPSNRLRRDLAATYQQRRMEEFQVLVSLGEDELAKQVLPEIQSADDVASLLVSVDPAEDANTPPAVVPPTGLPSTEEIPSATAEPSVTPRPEVSPTLAESETPTPTNSPTLPPAEACELITVVARDFGFVEVEVDDYGESYKYDDGGRIRFNVRNDNEVAAYLTSSTLDWNAAYAPPMYLDYFEFKGDRYFRTDSYSSPISAAAPTIKLGGNKWWEAIFYLENQPFEGSFTVTLTFNIKGIGDCSVTAQAQIPDDGE